MNPEFDQWSCPPEPSPRSGLWSVLDSVRVGTKALTMIAMSDETQRAATLIRKELERELRLEAGRDPDGTGQVNPDALKLMVEELFEGDCGSLTIR